MTDPTVDKRCTCPSAYGICDGPQIDCPRHGDPDAILASGTYRDRRGREWWRGPSMYWHEKATWKNIKRTLTGRLHDITPDQMRLLIERDKHRDECKGLRRCIDHPVPVVIDWSGNVSYPQFGAHWRGRHHYGSTLAEAFAAAENMTKEKSDG